MASTVCGEAITLQLAGRLDREGGEWLGQRVADLVASQQKFWVLNLSRVDFIDSAGLAALVDAFKQASQAGATLILSGVHPPARLILDITQLDRVFTIANELSDSQVGI
jgi:anti-anti-sigma factor